LNYHIDNSGTFNHNNDIVRYISKHLLIIWQTLPWPTLQVKVSV